jgi:hypothetical protein
LFEDTRSFEEAEQKYESCLKLLLKSGADVESLDQDGDTPLHMCVKVRVTQLTLQIGRLLLEHGADPNARDGLGFVPLHHAVSQKSEEFISLLLEFGVEPRMSVLVFNPCILFRQFPRAVKVFEKRVQQICQQRREEVKKVGQLKTCHVCQASHHCKRCSACFLIWYCSEACQMSDWVNHQPSCLKAMAQYRPAVIGSIRATDKLSFEEACMRYTGMLLNEENPQPSKSHFVVKVQKLAETMSRLAISNKEMTVSGLLQSKKNADLYQILKSSIEAHGVFGNVAFFQATWDAQNGLKVNPYVVLPPELW